MALPYQLLSVVMLLLGLVAMDVILHILVINSTF